MTRSLYQIGAFSQDISEQEIVYEKNNTYEIIAVTDELIGKCKLSVYKES